MLLVLARSLLAFLIVVPAQFPELFLASFRQLLSFQELRRQAILHGHGQVLLRRLILAARMLVLFARADLLALHSKLLVQGTVFVIVAILVFNAAQLLHSTVVSA